MEGRTPYEAIYGHTPDISSLCDFDFYEPVWFYDPHSFVLTNTGKVVARSTVQPIGEAEAKTEQVTREIKLLDGAIATKLHVDSDDFNELEVPDYLQQDDDDDVHTPRFDHMEPEAAMPEADEMNHEDFDK